MLRISAEDSLDGLLGDLLLHPLTCCSWLKRCDFLWCSQDYVISASGAVAGMGLFHLAEARPGAAALSDTSVTIQEAGVAGAMLVLRGTQ